MAVMSRFKDKPEYRLGEVSQRLLASYFQSRGWYIIPSYDYSGEDNNKAPRMYGANGSYVLPDLDVCKGGIRRWAEAKYKDIASWTRKTCRLEHGIGLRLFRHYKKVAEHTGDNVWLFIHEGCTGKVLARRILDLESIGRIYEGGKMDNQGMIFFPRREFELLATIEHPEAAIKWQSVRQLVVSILNRRVPIQFDKKQREFNFNPAVGQLTPNEQYILFRNKEAVLTMLASVDQLPWFGEV